MTKKASKEKPINSSIQINRNRGGGKKKPDLFARLRNESHPLDDIVPQTDAQPFTQPDVLLISDIDAHSDFELGAQTSSLSDAQLKTEKDAPLPNNWAPKPPLTGHPDETLPDAEPKNNRAPIKLIIGHPVNTPLDSKTPKSLPRASGNKSKLDVKTSEKTQPDARLEEKKQKEKFWEKNRSTDRLSLRPNKEILKKFKVFCAERDLGLTEFFEISGLKYIELDAQLAEQPDVLTPIDDRRLKMMFKTKPYIINLYLAYTAIFNELAAKDSKKWSARWLPRDDEAAARYNEIPPAIVELGIVQTQIQKGFGTSRIQTFKYYTDEIEKVLASGVSDEMLGTILLYHRQLWKNQTGREVVIESSEINES